MQFADVMPAYVGYQE